MSASPSSWIDRFVERWADLVVTRPRLVLALGLLLAALGAWAGAVHLEIDTDQDELVSSDSDYYQRYKKDYLGRFHDTEYLYAVIDVGGDPARAERLAEAFARRAREVPGVLFARWWLDVSPLERYPLHLLPEADLAATTSRLLAAKDDLRALSRADGLADVLEHATERTAELVLGGRGEEEGDAASFTFLDGLLADMERALRGEEPLGESARAFLAGEERDPRVRLYDSDPRVDPTGARARFLFVTLQVERDFGTLAVIEAPLRGLREALQAARTEVPGVEAGLTGRPVLAADEMISTNEDMTVATSVAFVAVALLYMLALRSVWRPLLIMGALAVGTAWTFGFAALAVGSLNLLSIVFTVILIGLGGDYGIHIVARYGEALAAGAAPAAAARTSLVGTGRGNITACAATAAAFLCTQLVDFRGLAELGLIAGGGMLLCLTAQQTVLPAALVLLEPRLGRGAPRAPFQYGALGALERWPRAVGGTALVVTLALAWPAARTSFDADLIGLQDPGLDSVKWERRLTAESEFSTWFAVFLRDDLEETRELVARLQARPALLARVESVLDLLPPPGRLERLEAISRALDPGAFEASAPRPLPLEGEDARAAAARMRDATGELAGLFETLLGKARRGGAEPEDLAALEALVARAGRVRAALEVRATAADPAQDAGWRGLSSLQVDLLSGLGRFVQDVLHPRPLGPADLPPEARERFVGRDGALAVLAFPADDLWVPAGLEAFHREVTAIDPGVTGTPVMVQRSVDAMRRGFVVALGYAALVVVLFVALDLRRPRSVLLALLPVALGLGWTAGIAAILGLRPNLANFFAVPMLIGIAVDNGVHLIHRWLDEPEHNPAVGTTGAAIVLTGLTNIVGLGSLAFAGHRGLASLGMLLALGTGVCVVSALVVVPPLLRRWAGPRVAAEGNAGPSPGVPG